MSLTHRQWPTRSFFIAIDRNATDVYDCRVRAIAPSFISRNKRGCLIAHNRIRQLLEKSVSRCLLVSTMQGGKIIELVNYEHSASVKYCSHLIFAETNI